MKLTGKILAFLLWALICAMAITQCDRLVWQILIPCLVTFFYWFGIAISNAQLVEDEHMDNDRPY